MLTDPQWEKLRAQVDAVCNRELDVVRDRAFQIERGSRWIKILLPDSVWDLEPPDAAPVPEADADEATPYWIEDPGHAWLVVRVDYLRHHHIVPSVYSYLSPLRGLAYLEDDDAAPVLKALFDDYGGANALPVRVISNFDDYVRRHGLERFPDHD